MSLHLPITSMSFVARYVKSVIANIFVTYESNPSHGDLRETAEVVYCRRRILCLVPLLTFFSEIFPHFRDIWYSPFEYLQIHRDFRKPLIVMAPKNLLRHKSCVSNLSEFDDVQGHPGFDKQGTRFKRLIKDKNDHGTVEESIRRLVLCSGKVSFG